MQELPLNLDSNAQRIIFIGDLHGQHKKLAQLLVQQDAVNENQRPFYLFVGDLIDNKTHQDIDYLATLTLVKSLVDAGRAECLMGNHELNAIGWVMRHPQTHDPLRPHSAANHKQHKVFLAEVEEDSPTHHSWVDWFKCRPFFIDFDEIRAIHACWDDAAIAQLRPYLNLDNTLKDEHWFAAFEKQHKLYNLLETLLKGPELRLPEGHSFFDKVGKERHDIRVRWWLSGAENYRQLAQVPIDAEDSVPELPLPEGIQLNPITVPVVVGHYTLSGEPAMLSSKVVCVDYNAAKDKLPLVAYEWYRGRGSEHSNDSFIRINTQLETDTE